MSTPLTIAGEPNIDLVYGADPELLRWARATVLAHAPAPEDDRGLTCDERGCLVCNVGGEGAAELIVAGVIDGYYPGPDAAELADAIAEVEELDVDLDAPLP